MSQQQLVVSKCCRIQGRMHSVLLIQCEVLGLVGRPGSLLYLRLTSNLQYIHCKRIGSVAWLDATVQVLFIWFLRLCSVCTWQCKSQHNQDRQKLCLKTACPFAVADTVETAIQTPESGEVADSWQLLCSTAMQSTLLHTYTTQHFGFLQVARTAS